MIIKCKDQIELNVVCLLLKLCGKVFVFSGTKVSFIDINKLGNNYLIIDRTRIIKLRNSNNFLNKSVIDYHELLEILNKHYSPETFYSISGRYQTEDKVLLPIFNSKVLVLTEVDIKIAEFDEELLMATKLEDINYTLANSPYLVDKTVLESYSTDTHQILN